MWPDWVSNPGPLTYKSGALPTGLHGGMGRGGHLVLFFMPISIALWLLCLISKVLH